MSEIVALDRARFDEVYSIMEKSFPPDEIRPYDEQKELLSNEFYKVYTLVDGGRICTVAATWQFNGVLFIEHLATDPDLRGRNMGAQMLGFLTEKYCEIHYFSFSKKEKSSKTLLLFFNVKNLYRT